MENDWKIKMAAKEKMKRWKDQPKVCTKNEICILGIGAKKRQKIFLSFSLKSSVCILLHIGATFFVPKLKIHKLLKKIFQVTI